MKRLLANIGIIICAIAMFIIGSATTQAQIAENVAQENAPAQVATNGAQTSPWGSDDEIGTLNMMTDASRLDILKQVASGKIHDGDRPSAQLEHRQVLSQLLHRRIENISIL